MTLGPYELNKVHLGDCIELMKDLPDKSVVTVTDAPYGVGVEYGEYEDSTENLSKLIALFVPELIRVSRVALVFTGTSNLFKWPEPTWTLCWNIPSASGLCSWGFSSWTPVLAYGKDPYLLNRMGSRSDVITLSIASEKTDHPCPKPKRVMKHFIERASVSKEDIIFDPFMGSGQTGIAAYETGRNFLGFEIDPRWCDLANKRIEAAKAQGKLF
jgi:site-specific DNA-methyltransferase (adenine-specific)